MKAGRLTNLAKYLPDPGRKRLWLFILILLKFSLLFFLISQHRPTTIDHTLAVCSGDCDSYLLPVDHLIDYGTYDPDYRMPGYGIPYFLFRLFFQKNIAASLLIVLQTMLDAFATYLLASAVLMLSGKKAGFYLTMFFYGVAVTVSCYNNWILTESMTASALIFGFYFLVMYDQSKKNYNILLSGLFFTWSYFLRPVNLPIIFIVLSFVVIENMRFSFRKLFLFLLPALVFQSVWTIRNYEVKKKSSC